MATISYKSFMGEIPNMDPHLLPDNRAQRAMNCEFLGGALEPMKAGAIYKNGMASNPVKGIFTDDGIDFLTWTDETQAYKSPVTNDTNRRVYYLTPSEGIFRVTPTPITPLGGSPATGNFWKAGVLRPTVAPALALVQRTTLADYPSASVALRVWYEYGGKQYGLTTPALTTKTAFTEYEFPVPAFDAEAYPAGATLVAELVFNSGASTGRIMALLIRAGSSAKSMALPGGLEAAFDAAGRITITWGVTETRAYVYTYRNSWLEEGAPSPAALISPTYMQDVRITVTSADFTEYRPLQDYKIYRTYGTSASYVGVTVTGSGLIFTDSSNAKSAVGTALQSTDWTPPPTGLQGLILMPNGWFAAFKDNTLFMSEPYRPHAWPYSMSFGRSIRGIASAQQSIVVTTADGVHVVTGAFPGSAQQIRLNLPQAGISQRSMTPIDASVAYASNDGIVFVQGASATIDVSQKLFTRVRWRENYGSNLDTMSFAYHDGCLVAASKAGDGFTIRLDEDVGNFSRVGVVAAGDETGDFGTMFYLPVTDTLYYAKGNVIYTFKGGPNKTFDWWGKDWIFPAHQTFGAFYIRCDGETRLTIYRDGAEVHTAKYQPGHHRLPSLGRGLRWSVRFSASEAVHEFAMAQTMGELRNV